jgi:hypothetical protein
MARRVGRGIGCAMRWGLRFRAAVGLWLAGALVVASVAAGEEGPWPAYLHDNQHTGRTELAVDARTLGAAPAWSAPSGFGIPLVVGDRIFAMRSQFGIGEDRTTVAAFDRRTGALLWHASQDLIFPSALAYADGVLVYAAIDEETFEPTLFVRRADSGALAYPVAIGSLFVAIPVLDHDPQSGALVAYLSSPAITNFGNGPSMEAVLLGPSSGSVLWADPIPRGSGGAIPTVVEEALVVAGTEYLAYDRATGAAHEFHQTGVSGALAATVAYDAARRQLYVAGQYDGDPAGALTAYRYVDPATLEFLWQATGEGIWSTNGPAIDEAGFVWTGSFATLAKRDPETGAVVDSTTGSFAIGMTPIVSRGRVWTFESAGFGDTVVYDQATLTEVRRLPGSRGDLNSQFGAPGALAPGSFLLDHGRLYDTPGFDVFVPEPVAALQLAAAAGTLAAMGRRRFPRNR